jgi:hypothetical protein
LGHTAKKLELMQGWSNTLPQVVVEERKTEIEYG